MEFGGLGRDGGRDDIKGGVTKVEWKEDGNSL